MASKWITESHSRAHIELFCVIFPARNIHDGSSRNRVAREAYLANNDIPHGNVLSVVRFTLHEIRATMTAAADRRLQ
jgi:hypothetical protein